jgi:hypothetical protein
MLMTLTTVRLSTRSSTRALLAAFLATSLACAPLANVFAQPLPAGAPGADASSSLVSSTPKPPKLEGRQNAAILYTDLTEALSKDILGDLQDRYSELQDADFPDATTCKALHEHQDYVRKIIDATNVTDCDWGINYQDGFGTLLPYLGTMRRYARIVALDARRCIAEKDMKGAAERYAALYHLSIHSAQGGSLICSLVGEAIQALACAQTQGQLDAGHLDIESARTILNAARGNVQDDTFNYLGAIKVEELMAVDWAKEHYTGPEAGQMLLKDCLDWADEEGTAWQAIKTMDGETLSREIEKTRPYFKAVRETWTATDGEERLKALAADVVGGKFGRATVAIGAFEHSFKSMTKGKAQLALTMRAKPPPPRLGRHAERISRCRNPA